MKAPISTLLAAVLFVFASRPLARAQLPTGAQVVAGDVNVAQAGNAMTLTQTSRHAVVNWQSFNLGAGASLRLQQSGADAALLARVVGNDPSQLLGSLQADGKLFLINPRGVVVGQGAVIDTAAFVASTLDVSDADFLRGGALTFKGDGAAGIVNLGSITAREGNVLLFARTVENAGAIAAPQGAVGLGAGTEVYLASADAPTFVVKANLPAAASGAKVGVKNSGAIAAAQAQLEAAGGSLYDLAVNQSGVVRATGSATVNGRVLLTAAGGTVGVSGEIAARNADGSGGEILIGGDYRGANAAIANAARTVVTADAKLDASAAADTAQAGRVIVWADDATRFLGTLNASGAGGGFAEVSGKHWLDFNPASPAQLGAGGTLLLDPAALVISGDANSGTSTAGTDPFTFGAATEPATLNVTTLQNQLTVSNVILDTSHSGGSVDFASAVTWATNNSLTVRAGGDIKLNASLTGGAASTLALYAGLKATAPGESGLTDINGDATLDAGATLTVGTFVFGANAAAAPAGGYTLETPARSGLFFGYGNVNAGTVEVDLAGGEAGMSLQGSDNSIGAFRTAGTGSLASTYIADHHGGLDVALNSSAVSAPSLTFITPGALTLKSGSSLNFAESGTVVLASTGGAFVNQAGGSVFGANARFLIYSSTTGATTKGGLAGTDVFSHPYNASDDFSGDFTSRFFFTGSASLPILTYAANNAARTYGAANPTFTFTRTGLQSGVADDVTGAPAFSTTATQSSGVGAYAIDIARGTLASANYDFAFTPGTLTIDRAPLVASVGAYTRVFGENNPAFGFAGVSGLVNGDTAAVLTGVSFSTAATPSSIPAGYAVNATASAANYAVTVVPGALVVNRAPLTLTAPSLTATIGAVPTSFAIAGAVAPVPGGPQFTLGGVTNATNTSAAGRYVITPVITTLGGFPDVLLPLYYDIRATAGTLTLQNPTTPSVLTSLNPTQLNGPTLSLNNGGNPINTNVTTTNSTVTVKQDGPLQIAANPYVELDTPKLTHTQFADYFGTFAADMSAVRTSMADSYKDLLGGQGKSGSAYESLSPDARGLLAGFMDGSLAVSDLQSRIARGDQAAVAAFGFIMPNLIERTRDKPLDQLTAADRMILGRLADITEKRRTETIRLAQEKYQAMLKAQAERAELNGMSTLFIGPGDFQAIAESASQETVARYVGAAIGGGASAGAATALLAIPAVAAAVFPHSIGGAASAVVAQAVVEGVTVGTSTVGATTAGGAAGGSSVAGAAAGPATAVAMMVVLAVRATQIADSVKNEKSFNDLMSSWQPGSQLDSIATLKSDAMNQDMKLSTLLLSAELLKPGP